MTDQASNRIWLQNWVVFRVSEGPGGHPRTLRVCSVRFMNFSRYETNPRMCQDGFISTSESKIMASLTKEIIEAALSGFESQKQHIDAQLAELRAMLSAASAASDSTSRSTSLKKRRMSEAGRQAIAEAQRRRWATQKRDSAPSKSKPRAKRKLSAAGRAAIVAALKKRWAERKAATAGEIKTTKKGAGKKAD